MVDKSLSLAMVCLGLFVAAAAPGVLLAGSNGSEPFEVAVLIHVGGKGGFDYVTIDSEGKRLYIPRGTHTQVLDVISGKVVADIPGQHGNHGVALDREAGRGFISDGYPGYVVIFDLKTNALLGKVEVDRGADGILFDPASKKVYLSCGGCGTLSPVPVDVDPASGKADPSIPLRGKPESLASDRWGRIYVALEDTDQVAVIDSKVGKVVDKWSIAPGGVPTGVAIDPEHHRLFVGCRRPQKLVVLNTDDGHVLADLPIGAGVDALAFDNGHIFASCNDGTLNIAKETSAGKFEIVQDLKTRRSAKTLAVDHATHRIYLPAVEFEENPDRPGRQRVKADSFMVVVVRPARK